MSLWDKAERTEIHMINPNGKNREDQIADPPPAGDFYNEADVLEDAVLFPEELAQEEGDKDAPAKGRSKALYSGKSSEMERFSKSEPDWV